MCVCIGTALAGVRVSWGGVFVRNTMVAGREQLWLY
jgi:hypothetical protein